MPLQPTTTAPPRPWPTGRGGCRSACTPRGVGSSVQFIPRAAGRQPFDHHEHSTCSQHDNNDDDDYDHDATDDDLDHCR